MKVVHFGEFAPHAAGMYHTIHDLILAERQMGIDAQFVDWTLQKYQDQFFSRVGLIYDGVETVSPGWAKKADIIVRHSALPSQIENGEKPIVSMLHGRPAYTFELEYQERMNVLSQIIKNSQKPNYKMMVTFWKENLSIWKLLMKENVNFGYIPSMVDLNEYNPDGPKLDFGKESGYPNIVIADLWRFDVNPLKVLLAASEFIRTICPSGKLHIFGLKIKKVAIISLINSLREKGIIGQTHPLIVKGLDKVYRTADILVTPHRIATRVIREALASGCPIVAGSGCKYTKYQADPNNTEAFVMEIKRCWNDTKKNRELLRKTARTTAEKEFNFEQAGQAALDIYNKVLGSSTKKEMQIFNFIAYAPNGVKEDIGKTYNDYMELLPSNAWACFLDHDAMWTTLDWYKQLEEVIKKNSEYGFFGCMTNRVGNIEQLAKSVSPTNHDIEYHRDIGKQLQTQYFSNVKDVTKLPDNNCLSGVVMLVNKSAWKKVGGFPVGEFLGVDNFFHIKLKRADIKVGLMKGVYVYHWYRYKNSEFIPLNGMAKKD